jgi:serine/threonine-protein kinase
MAPLLAPGTSLGAYEVQSLLGSGGMAEVYGGLDRNLQRPVAIKVLSQAAVAQPGIAARFRQEAQLIAGLRHPHIVQVYDFGEQQGVTYMVQELLRGPTLEQRLSKLTAHNLRLQRDEIVEIARQLASALDAVHAAGIIHRDVKPANIMWNAAGALVLTDFGIAKNTLAGFQHTRAGEVFGSPAYIAPEQARGLPLTPACDVYAMSVVLYELIGGRPPFTDPDPLAVAHQHIATAPAPLRPLRADLPEAAEHVVLRGLAKEPAARFARAGALAQALDHGWQQGQPPQPQAAALPIHQLPTRAWTPPASAPASHPQVAPARPAAPLAAPTPQGTAAPSPALAPATARPSTRVVALRGAQQGSLRRLMVLGLLLAACFAAGVLLALRGEATQEQQPAGPTTAAGSPLQTMGDAAPPDAASQLRHLLSTSGGSGAALLPPLEAAQQAIHAGDRDAAAAQLFTLQRLALDAVRDGTLEPATGRSLLTGIDSFAGRNGIQLPLVVGSTP